MNLYLQGFIYMYMYFFSLWLFLEPKPDQPQNLHRWCLHLMLHSVCILCSEAGQRGPGAAQLTRLTSAYNTAQPF